MPKINGNEIRPGAIIEHDGGLWASVKVNHVKPGKGGAFVCRAPLGGFEGGSSKPASRVPQSASSLRRCGLVF